MKRNIIHLTGIVLCAIGLFSGCNEDLPSYTSLTVDAETLTINLKGVLILPEAIAGTKCLVQMRQ